MIYNFFSIFNLEVNIKQKYLLYFKTTRNKRALTRDRRALRSLKMLILIYIIFPFHRSDTERYLCLRIDHNLR